MAAKTKTAAKTKGSDEAKLKARIRKLKAERDKAHKKVSRLTKENGRLGKAAADAQAKARKLAKRLDKVRSAEPPASEESEASPQPASSSNGVAPAGRAGKARSRSSRQAGPDAAWTVVQLRAEARARGITGVSNKSKAELLEVLS